MNSKDALRSILISEYEHRNKGKEKLGFAWFGIGFAAITTILMVLPVLYISGVQSPTATINKAPANVPDSLPVGAEGEDTEKAQSDFDLRDIFIAPPESTDEEKNVAESEYSYTPAARNFLEIDLPELNSNGKNLFSLYAAQEYERSGDVSLTNARLQYIELNRFILEEKQIVNGQDLSSTPINNFDEYRSESLMNYGNPYQVLNARELLDLIPEKDYKSVNANLEAWDNRSLYTAGERNDTIRACNYDQYAPCEGNMAGARLPKVYLDTQDLMNNIGEFQRQEYIELVDNAPYSFYIGETTQLGFPVDEYHFLYELYGKEFIIKRYFYANGYTNENIEYPNLDLPSISITEIHGFIEGEKLKAATGVYLEYRTSSSP